jgi:hypothetical protein
MTFQWKMEQLFCAIFHIFIYSYIQIENSTDLCKDFEEERREFRAKKPDITQ